MVAPILEFRSATLTAPNTRSQGLTDIELSLAPGDMALVHLEPGRELLPLAAAAQGLVTPLAGSVCFVGAAWPKLDPQTLAKQRGQIGRVFESWGWVSNLNVLENVLLREEHHTRRSAADIESEADALARTFGLPRVPRGRPELVPRNELRRAEWVRAFVGRPRLILLERPLRDVSDDFLQPLIAAVESARRGDAAVVWLTTDAAVWKTDFAARGLTRYRVHGSRLEQVEA
jgi:phospholipid/cholesterol/gamma-HCH transport system ATP-binding protein